MVINFFNEQKMCITRKTTATTTNRTRIAHLLSERSLQMNKQTTKSAMNRQNQSTIQMTSNKKICFLIKHFFFLCFCFGIYFNEAERKNDSEQVVRLK